MQTYDCIIIEDEPIAIDIITDYIKQVPFLKVRNICTNALYALRVIEKEKIDLIFLDIHLPGIKGIDFIKELKSPPAIIITSAYHEYALPGYEYNVVDYLLKPFNNERFLKAVSKFKEMKTRYSTPSYDDQYLLISINKKKMRIFIRDIMYVESLREYVKIVTANKNFITRLQIGDLESFLPSESFMRIHRSFIVSINNIDAFTHTDLEVKGVEIPIGKNYKTKVLKKLESGQIKK